MACTKACLDFAMTYTNASCEYSSSFRARASQFASSHGEQQQHEENMYRTEYRKYLKTYKPFYVKIGSFNYIRRTTFVEVTSDVVLQGVVTFLLT